MAHNMQKALAMCMTALLLLAGCIGTDDNKVEEIIGCDDETSLTYVEDVTESQEELCIYEEVLESSIIDFIDFIEEGPDMENLTTNVGYTMEVTQQVEDEVWHYLETTVVSPDGYKLTIQDTYGEEHSSEEVIMSGNEIQYHLSNDTQDYTVRMKHAGTFSDAFEGMMSPDDDWGDDLDMDSGSDVYWEPYYGGYCEWEGNPEDDSNVWSCKDDESDSEWDTWWYYCELHDGDWFCTDNYGQSSDFEDSADNDRYFSDDEGMSLDDFDVSSWDSTNDLQQIIDWFNMNYMYSENEDMLTVDDFLSFCDANANDVDYLVAECVFNTAMSMLGSDDDEDDTEGRQAPQITGIDITQDDEMVTIAVTGDFTDDPETAPYFTLMLVKNGNSPEYAIINIQEDNFYVLDGERGMPVWDYLEDGYAEVHVPTDFLLSGFFDIQFSVWIYGQSNQTAVSSQFTFFVPEDDDDDSNDDWWTDVDDVEEMEVELDEDGNPDADFYTGLYNPMSATITDFAMDETGYTFSGQLNFPGSPFNYFEIHTDSDFTMLGFTMEDNTVENNWVEFMLIDSGDTSTDQTIPLSALPYILVDMSEMDAGEGDEEEDNDGDGYAYSSDCDDYDWYLNPGAEEVYDGLDNDCDGLVDYDDDSCFECWEELWFALNIDLGDSTYSNTSLNQILDYQSNYESDTPLGLGFIGMSAEDIELIFMEVDTDNSSTLDSEEMEEFHIQLETQIWDEYNANDDGEDYTTYHCVPFVEYNTEGFSIFNNTNLDSSMCGEPIEDSTYEFDNNETWTMPQHLIWEDCWTEGNETVCEQGEITYNETTTELWQTANENNYMDCDGNYDNNTSMCTEWLGNVTESDEGAFIISHPDEELLVMYQYDAATQSGLVIFVDTNDDMNMEEMFAMFDANEDGEINATEWADMSNQSDNENLSQEEYDDLVMLIDMYDDNNSGGLDFDEFVNMMESMDEDSDDGDMEPAMMFEIFDSNEDGEVTASEWSDFTNQTDDPVSEEDFGFLAAMIDSYDADDSGGLDIDEFMNFFEGMEEGGENEPSISMYLVIGLFDFAPGDLSDYSVELAMCDGEQITDLQCEDSVYSVLLGDITATSEEQAMIMSMTMPIIFIDSDESGTLTSMDYVMVNHDLLDIDEEWNFTRLHSGEADAYTDENPMMHLLPGFTSIFATIGLLGAALIRRE